MGDNEKLYNELKERVKARRLGNVPNSIDSCDVTVRELEYKTTGRCKTHLPKGDKVFITVKLENKIMNLQNLKSSIAKECGVSVSRIDILDTNTGPSCTKDAHIRKKRNFLYRLLPINLDSQSNESDTELPSVSVQDFQVSKSPLVEHPSNKSDNLPQTSFSVASNSETPIPPASICIAQLLAAGARRAPKPLDDFKTFRLERFVLESSDGTELGTSFGSWHVIDSSFKLKVKSTVYNQGGFRKVYMAFTETEERYVVKQLKPETIRDLKLYADQNEDEAVHRIIQSHTVARYLCQKFAYKVKEKLSYDEVYLGIDAMSKELYFVERFVPNATKNCKKYINNTGVLYKDEDLKQQDLAEAFSHFTFEETNHRLMVLDIQGWPPYLIDPSVTSAEVKNEQDIWMYSIDNAGIVGIETFLGNHLCNNFCKILNLPSQLGYPSIEVVDSKCRSTYPLRNIKQKE